LAKRKRDVGEQLAKGKYSPLAMIVATKEGCGQITSTTYAEIEMRIKED